MAKRTSGRVSASGTQRVSPRGTAPARAVRKSEPKTPTVGKSVRAKPRRRPVPAGSAVAAATPRAVTRRGTPRVVTRRGTPRAVTRRGTPRKAVSAGGRSPQWRAAYREMQQGVRRLEVSIGDVGAGLHFAERSIRHQARERILGLRREAAEQLRGLRSRQREAAGKLARVGNAADESWSEIRASFDAIVADARATAASVAARFREALLS